MVSVPPPQVIVEQPYKVDINLIRGHAPLVRHRSRQMIPESGIPLPRVLTTEDLFTKHERCYHYASHGRIWKGSGEGRNIVEQAMDEILKNDTYIGFSHNEKQNTVYLTKRSEWNGIDDESIRCESRPVPKGLTHKNSFRWKWHSLYIKK